MTLLQINQFKFYSFFLSNIWVIYFFQRLGKRGEHLWSDIQGPKVTMVNVNDNYDYILLYHWLECFGELKVSLFIGTYLYGNRWLSITIYYCSDFKQNIKVYWELKLCLYKANCYFYIHNYVPMYSVILQSFK